MRKNITSIVAVASLSLVLLGACGKKGDAPMEGKDTSMAVGGVKPTDSTPAKETADAANYPMVGGAAMYPTKDIVDNAVNSKDHTTLVAAVKAAGLVETLKGAGPFTVFAPTNAAFEKLPAGTVETLVKPENKAKLTGILTYHVVAGKQDAASIMKAIDAGNGKATFKSVQGGTLTASKEGNGVMITDEKGGKARVTMADVFQSNGVIHVIDGVVMHK